MMSFDDDEFYGLDEEVAGDGTSDDTTRSLSQFVERRYHANNKFLKSRDWKVCLNPYRKRAGEITEASGVNFPDNARLLSCFHSPYAKRANFDNSTTGQFLFILPVLIAPDTEKFRITMRGRVDSAFENLDGVKSLEMPEAITPPDAQDLYKQIMVKAHLVKGFTPNIPEHTQSDGSFLGENEEKWTSDDNPVHRIEVDVDKTLQNQTNACLMLEMHTNYNDKSMTPPVDYFGRGDMNRVETWENHILNLEDPNNTSSQVDELIEGLADNQVLEFQANNAPGDRFQPTIANYVDKRIGVQLGDETPDTPHSRDPFENDEEGLQYIGRGVINSVTPQSWVFESITDKTTPAHRFSQKTDQSMKPQKTVGGKDISKHASNTDSNYRRPRLKAIGPKGRQTSGTSSAEVKWDNVNSYYSDRISRRWSLVRFDTASTNDTAGNSLEDRLTFRIDKGGCTLNIINQYALVSVWDIPANIHNVQVTDNDTRDTVSRGHVGMQSRSQPDLDSLRLEAGADVTFGYNVRQRGSSATEDIVASSTKTQNNQSIYLGNIRNTFPILRTMFEMFFTEPDGASGDDLYEYTMDEYNSDPNFVFREGWVDRNDMNGIIQTVNHRVDIPDDSTTDFSRPFDVNVYLNSQSNITADYFSTSQGSTVPHPTDRIYLVNLQTAVWEEPR